MSATVERHLPGIGRINAGDDIEERRLARAVRPDQADDFSPARPSRSSRSSATTPPKRRVRLRAASSWQTSRAGEMTVMPATREIAAHRARQQALGPEQQHHHDQRRIEHEAVFLDRLQLLRDDDDDDGRHHHAPGIADAAKQQNRHQDERVSKRVVVGLHEAADHAVQRTGYADEEISEQEGGDLPAHDVEAEAARRGLIEPQRIEIEADPRALDPPHQHECEHEDQQAQEKIADVERELRCRRSRNCR